MSLFRKLIILKTTFISFYWAKLLLGSEQLGGLLVFIFKFISKLYKNKKKWPQSAQITLSKKNVLGNFPTKSSLSSNLFFFFSPVLALTLVKDRKCPEDFGLAFM